MIAVHQSGPALFAALRDTLVERASTIAHDFMSRRGDNSRGKDYWSDISLSVRTRSRSNSALERLEVQWRKRIWLRRSPNSKRKRGYVLKHLSRRALLLACKDWEREEVIRTRDLLTALQSAHRDLLRMEMKLARHGAIGDEADLLAGFVPKPTKRGPKRASFRPRATSAIHETDRIQHQEAK